MPELKNRQFLDFEKPIKDLYDQVEVQKASAEKSKIDLSDTIAKLEQKIIETKNELTANLTPWQKVQLSRAIIPQDNPHFERLSDKASSSGAKIVSFGRSHPADVYPKSLRVEPDQSTVELPSRHSYRLRTPGEHIALNSLAVVAVLQSLAVNWGAKVDMDFGLQTLQFITATSGRGAQARYLVRAPGSAPLDEVLLIDESYNANPASMRAALAVLGATSPAPGRRRIAVMGDMRELGDLGPQLHGDLIDAIAPNKVDAVFACGPLMQGLFKQLRADHRGAWSEASTGLIAALFDALQPGDVVMIKGSLGTNMAPIVNEFKARDQRLRKEWNAGSGPA